MDYETDFVYCTDVSHHITYLAIHVVSAGFFFAAHGFFPFALKI